MLALPDSGSFHGDFAGRKTDLVCQPKEEEGCREEEENGGEEDLFLSWIWGWSVLLFLVWGIKKYLGRNSRSGDKFPLIKLHLSFFGRGRMVPGESFLKWNGGWNGVSGPRGLASRVQKKVPQDFSGLTIMF
jgi:hypothetical protein